MLFDTHAHLYAAEFEADREAMMERASTQQVTHIMLPNIEESSVAGMYALQQRYPQQVLLAMGLHPCSVKEDYVRVLKNLEQELDRPDKKFYAIGEMGLDFYWDKQYAEQQREAFRIQCTWALQRQLPLLIHSRESTRSCLDLLQEMDPDNKLRGVFHCFSGTAEEAEDIVARGFYLGIGGVVTFKKSGLSDLLQPIPLQHLVLETDAPYLAPVPYRGKRNESSYLPLIAQHLALTRNISVEEVGRITTENAMALFGIRL